MWGEVCLKNAKNARHNVTRASLTLFVLAITLVVVPAVRSHEKAKQEGARPVPQTTRETANETLGETNKEALISQGKNIFVAKCQNCHSDGKSGGCLGPVLAGESGRRTRAFVLDRITDSEQARSRFAREYNASELMPHLRVKNDDAKRLATYVLSLPAPGEVEVRGHGHLTDTPSGAAVTFSRLKLSTSTESGKKLLWEKGCLACHSIGGVGGTYAPPFDRIGSRQTQAWINEKISTAQLYAPQENQLDEYSGRALTMPPISISKSEIGDIAAFLSSLK